MSETQSSAAKMTVRAPLDEVRKGVRYACGSYFDLVTAIEPDRGYPSGFRVDYTIERPDGSAAGHGGADLDTFRETRTVPKPVVDWRQRLRDVLPEASDEQIDGLMAIADEYVEKLRARRA